MTRLLFLLFVVILIFAVIERLLRLIQSGESITLGSMKKLIRQSGKSLWQGLQLFVVIWVIYIIVSLWLQSRN